MAVGIGFGLIPVAAGFLLGPRKPDSEKLSPYECGFEAFDDSRMKFDVRYYLVAILFIIFDLEIAFLLPWAVSLDTVGKFGLLAMALFLFRVPVEGSVAALTVGALLYVVASTGFGLLVSSFVKTQIAAIFAAAILSIMPTINFSGFLSPVSALEAGGKLIGYGFPAGYFQQISVGTFTKALGFTDLLGSYLALALCIVVILALSLALLRLQER